MIDLGVYAAFRFVRLGQGKVHVVAINRPLCNLALLKSSNSRRVRKVESPENLCKNCMKVVSRKYPALYGKLAARAKAAEEPEDVAVFTVKDQLIKAGVPKDALDQVEDDRGRLYKAPESNLPSSTLRTAFTWDSSPQGYVFWSDVHMDLAEKEWDKKHPKKREEHACAAPAPRETPCEGKSSFLEILTVLDAPNLAIQEVRVLLEDGREITIKSPKESFCRGSHG